MCTYICFNPKQLQKLYNKLKTVNNMIHEEEIDSIWSMVWQIVRSPPIVTYINTISISLKICFLALITHCNT